MTGTVISLAEANFGHLVGKLVRIKASNYVLANTLEYQRRYSLDKEKYPVSADRISLPHYDPTKGTLTFLSEAGYRFGEVLGLVVSVKPMKTYLSEHDKTFKTSSSQDEAAAVILRDEHLVLVSAYLLSSYSRNGSEEQEEAEDTKIP